MSAGTNRLLAHSRSESNDQGLPIPVGGTRRLSRKFNEEEQEAPLTVVDGERITTGRESDVIR